MRVLILLALVGAALSVPEDSQRVVGGTLTTVQKYPYMANMQYAWLGIWFYQLCGGSLLTTRTVISAAHCYLGDSVSWWRVRLGTSLAESGGTIYHTQIIVIHPRFSERTKDYDVAIVWLSSTVTLGPLVATVRIAEPNYILPDNALVTTIGWGSINIGGSYPNQLLEADINIISQELCAEHYAYLKTQSGYENWPDVTPRMICAGILDVGGKGPCSGDGGGPVLHDHDVLVGIVSWGQGCADPYYPIVNTRVSALVDWIVANSS